MRVEVVVPSPAFESDLEATLLDQPNTNVLLRVGQLDVTRNGHTIVHDLRGAVCTLKHHIAPLGA
eukprot:CAMPEP_0205913046 /NCGR_PEP_ID=MMETSP1325-20131115/6250_1 /ASSEMBLY_ACC=CAM_ASM_000708 /TAXON_ID=236786 /ORGANISM="Florenciella sp., Strain RCC1007" /LENGTH=64 /DNA_ID=CAMNT_0053279833 /DNA_START=98 /DNA_END=287 /DNA_ORIENTATION=+